MKAPLAALAMGAWVLGCAGSGGGAVGVGASPDARPGGQPAVGPPPVTGESRPPGVGEGVGAGIADHVTLESRLASWPSAARKAAEVMTQKYGPPTETTESMLIWRNHGPWIKTVITNRETQHRFPAPHSDVMEQVIQYRVPPDKVDELAAYDGSVTVRRTEGTLAARCDVEGANFLALNLAHEIVTGKRSVEEARAFYGEQIMAMKAGRPAPYTERLLFEPPSDSADPDKPLEQ